MNTNTSFVPTINSTAETCHLLIPLDLFYWSLEQIVIQGRRAVDGKGGCRYRAQYEGRPLKCAAGHCIPDDTYDSKMEEIVLDAPGEPTLPPSYEDATPGYSLLNDYFKARFSVDQLKAIKCAQLVHDAASFITVTEIVTTRSTTMGHITAFIDAHNAGHSFNSSLEDFLKD